MVGTYLRGRPLSMIKVTIGRPRTSRRDVPTTRDDPKLHWTTSVSSAFAPVHTRWTSIFHAIDSQKGDTPSERAQAR